MIRKKKVMKRVVRLNSNMHGLRQYDGISCNKPQLVDLVLCANFVWPSNSLDILLKSKLEFSCMILCATIKCIGLQ